MTDPAVAVAAVVVDTDNVVDKSDEITWCLKFHCHLCYARVLSPEVATLLIFSLELASVADRQGPLRPARSSSGGHGTTLHSRSGGRYTDTDGLNIQIPAAPPADCIDLDISRSSQMNQAVLQGEGVKFDPRYTHQNIS